jgi:rRNA-processing protein FCF1
VRVVHAAGSGDDDIVARVADAVRREPGLAVTVVTADRGLRARVEELGAQTIGPGWLWRRLDEASAE